MLQSSKTKAIKIQDYKEPGTCVRVRRSYVIPKKKRDRVHAVDCALIVRPQFLIKKSLCSMSF